MRMLILGVILAVEQFVLAVFAAEQGSLLQKIYFYSSIFMGLFAVFSALFMLNLPVSVNRFHELFEMSFGLFGLAVALLRFIFVDNNLATIPTIYIAVLYGVAVIFVLNLWQGIIVYAVFIIVPIIFIPMSNHDIVVPRFRVDVITNGLISWILLYLNSQRFINSFLDKKKIETINSELREQSIRDGLTGLYNRRKLDEVFSEVCLKSSRYSNDFAVIMLDIDHFKSINDSYGHHIGDSILIEFSKIIENGIREVDVCGRWGGEEFLVICQETELEYASLLAERLREKIENHNFSNGLHITASFGVASWNKCRSEEQLLKIVDERLYKAKAQGRNLVVSV